MNKKQLNNLFYDGFNSKLIETADFDGLYEIPMLKKATDLIIPSCAVPYSKIKYSSKEERDILVFYEKDPAFRDFISLPQEHLGEIKDFKVVSTPDCSVYRDMPFSYQIGNISISRSVGYFLQTAGKLVYPNVRWGDERTYKRLHGEKPISFAGIPKGNIVTIGTYGCSKSREDKYHLQAGLEAMLDELEPKAVIIYGSMPKKLFDQYLGYTDFYRIPDWTTLKKGGSSHGDR